MIVDSLNPPQAYDAAGAVVLQEALITAGDSWS